MLIQVFKSKIHRATVTEANLNYVGSITIDEALIEAAGLIEGERVQIVNNNNGERLETYVIRGRTQLRKDLPEWRRSAQGRGGRHSDHHFLWMDDTG